METCEAEVFQQSLAEALLVEQSAIEEYKGNLSKSAEFWKAVENKFKIEAVLRKLLNKADK